MNTQPLTPEELSQLQARQETLGQFIEDNKQEMAAVLREGFARGAALFRNPDGEVLDARPCDYASGFEDGQSETQLAAELALSGQEVHSKETMDEVRDSLGRVLLKLQTGEPVTNESVHFRLLTDALTKLTP